MAIPTIIQARFVAGSVGDLCCEFVMLPGKLIAVLFHDRGTASPEFLWRSRVATAVTFSAFAYFILRARRFSN